MASQISFEIIYIWSKIRSSMEILTRGGYVKKFSKIKEWQADFLTTSYFINDEWNIRSSLEWVAKYSPQKVNVSFILFSWSRVFAVFVSVGTTILRLALKKDLKMPKCFAIRDSTIFVILILYYNGRILLDLIFNIGIFALNLAWF